MTLVSEIIEKSKEYGREFTLCCVVLVGCGFGLRVVWESTNARLVQQDSKIDKSDEFIRTELMTLNKQSLDVTRKATDVMDKATGVMDKATGVMDAAVKALDRSTHALERATP